MDIWTEEKSKSDKEIKTPADIISEPARLSPYQQEIEERLAISVHNYVAYKNFKANHSQDVEKSITNSFFIPFKDAVEKLRTPQDTYPAVITVNEYDLKKMHTTRSEFLLYLRKLQHTLKKEMKLTRASKSTGPHLFTLTISLRQ